jgi:hypothetical protein
MSSLEDIADRQAIWSVTANALKAKLDRARLAVFVFSVLGALLATLASQFGTLAGGGDGASSPSRTWLAIAGAASLATATFFTQRLLGSDHTMRWVRARAISEALKREAYKFATSTTPYNQQDADIRLDAERQRIENDGDDLIALQVINAGAGSTPRKTMTLDDYVERRVNGQIDFYTKRAYSYRAAANRLRLAEFLLALGATLITAAASATGKSVPLFGAKFDIAAVTAVLTTLGGAVLAHAEAVRYDFLVTIYLATARRLEDRRSESHQAATTFINDCENIIQTENTSWIAKWSKPAA